MSHFHNYFSRNIALINMQMPGATKVASFKLWGEGFNRHVKKGERSIRIFAPMAEKVTKEIEKLDPETGAPLLMKAESLLLKWLRPQNRNLSLCRCSMFPKPMVIPCRSYQRI